MGNFAFTAQEAEWLAEHIPGRTFDETAADFSAAFRPITRERVFTWSRNHNVPCGVKRHKPTIWTPELDAWFAAYVPGHEECEIREEGERLFGITLTEGQIGTRKRTLGVKSGTHGGRWQKGQEPPNKGKTWDELGYTEEQRARMLATCFKPGEVNGRAKAVEQPVGTERVSKDGYIEVKVHDGLQARPNSNFRFKHHVVWEEANGMPVPPHTNIVFADGDKGNLDPGNLVAVPRRLWALIRSSGCRFSTPDELRAQMLLAEVRLRVGETERAPRPCKRCGREFKPRYQRQRTCDVCLGRTADV